MLNFSTACCTIRSASWQQTPRRDHEDPCLLKSSPPRRAVVRLRSDRARRELGVPARSALATPCAAIAEAQWHRRLPVQRLSGSCHAADAYCVHNDEPLFPSASGVRAAIVRRNNTHTASFHLFKISRRLDVAHEQQTFDRLDVMPVAIRSTVTAMRACSRCGISRADPSVRPVVFEVILTQNCCRVRTQAQRLDDVLGRSFWRTPASSALPSCRERPQ